MGNGKPQVTQSVQVECVCQMEMGQQPSQRSYCSYILAFQTQCNLRQKLVFQYPQSTQLKSNSFMLSLIPSELCFKALGSQNEFKITKRNANQSTTNHLTGALEENFIATDINHLLITDPILLTDNMWLSSHNLEPQRGKSNPNNLHIALRKNALK